MKKDKSKKRRRMREDEPKRKSKGQSEMDELKDMWDEDDEEGGGDDTIDKLNDGKNTRRVLPQADPDEPFFKKWAMHFNMGPDGTDSFRCIEPGGPFGKNKKSDAKRRWKAKVCPACKEFCRNKTRGRKFKFGSPEGKKFWHEHVRPYRAKLQFCMAVCKPKAKDEDDRNKVFVLRCGEMIAKPLIEARYDSDVGDITSPKRGRNIKITKKQLSKTDSTNVEYKTVILDKSPVENWDELKDKLPDLDTYVPEALEPDAILEIMNGDGDGDDDEPRRKKSKKGRRDDDDMDEDLDDDDDEEGSERKLRTKKRRRGDDEEVDPDAEEEDDDDDERPSKKKKSKMRDKLSKKANREDDDDEGDDDDEDLDDEDDEEEDDEEEDDDGDEEADEEDDEDDEEDDEGEEDDDDD